MKRRLELSLLSAATLAIALASAPALAATTEAVLNVTATVLSTCTVAVDSHLQFDVYDPTASKPATAGFTVTCNEGTGYDVNLEGTNDNRAMTNGTDLLQYDLYTDAGHNDEWETPVPGTAGAAAGGFNEKPYAVYGVIPAGQWVPSGNYTDTITVTVTF